MESHLYLNDILSEIGEIPVDSIVSKTLYKDENLKVVFFGFAAGQELSEHTAATPAIIHFLKGEAKLTLGKDAREAKAGTWVHMPPQLPHTIHAETPVMMLLYLLSS
jgi:quercetin dioxygenase-like cupin family protein